MRPPVADPEDATARAAGRPAASARRGVEGPAHYDYIDALRGYAVLGVIVVHTAKRAPALGWPLGDLAGSGQYGVQLFFVASALTLMLSWHARAEGATAFYVRRLFRIAPMFWLAILWNVLVDGFAPREAAPDGVTLGDVLATATFLHGWHPRSINSVVPGGWSIAVEMTFYVVFPLLAARIRSLPSAVLAFLLALSLALAQRSATPRLVEFLLPQTPPALVANFTYYWIVSQMPVFLVGVGAFFVLRDVALPQRAAELGVFASLAAIVSIRALDAPGPWFIEYALAFGLLAVCLGNGAGRWLVNAAAIRLGKISYSAYLWHFAVLATVAPIAEPFALEAGHGIPAFMAMLTATILVTAALSAATYAAIEKPMIAIGGRVARRLRIRDAMPARNALA